MNSYTAALTGHDTFVSGQSERDTIAHFATNDMFVIQESDGAVNSNSFVAASVATTAGLTAAGDWTTVSDGHNGTDLIVDGYLNLQYTADLTGFTGTLNPANIGFDVLVSDASASTVSLGAGNDVVTWDAQGGTLDAGIVKLPQPFGFSIEYTDKAMNLRWYYPDFVAVDGRGDRWLLETKGAETDDVSFKDAAAARWCENASDLTKTQWRYLKVPQKAFELLQPGRLVDLNALRGEYSMPVIPG